MPDQILINSQIMAIFSEVNYLIRLLYTITDPMSRALALNQLWNRMVQLQFLFQLLQVPPQLLSPQLPQAQRPTRQTPASPSPSPTTNQQTLPAITREQLAQFNGQNGRPAYVAVNGIVYDVTNHAAWSLATHFGLTAGKDLTAEFASCHAGQQWILRTLPQVGRLVA